MPFLRGTPTRSNTLHLSKQYNTTPCGSSLGIIRDTAVYRTTNERGPWMGDTWVQETFGCCNYLLPVNQQPHLPPRTSSKHPYKLRHIATNTNAYKYSFFPRTIPLWNNLSLLQSSVTVNSPEAFQVYALPIIRTFCHPNWPMKPSF